MKADPRLSRLDSCRLAIANRHGIEATLFANTEVPVDAAAVDELASMLDLAETVDQFANLEPDSFDVAPEIEKVAVTPDFHKAAGIPVGTVLATRGFMVPQAIGNDINCGMRVHTTELSVEKVRSRLDELEHQLRHVFFAGGRNLPMTRHQREALLLDGLAGLVESTPRDCSEGLWRCFHDAEVGATLGRVDQRGSLKAKSTPGMENYLGEEQDRVVRDQVTGCVGGGNHFVELQYVEKIHDGAAAHAWGLKTGMVTVMIHSGSVAIGHIAGGLCRQALRQMYPAGLPHPGNGIFILPQGRQHTSVTGRFWDALHNAANFAFGNRLFLSLMAWSVMREVLGEFDLPLLYDAPHNLLWRESDAPGARIIHRKGACPARGFEAMAGTEFECYGQPVMVPGSMGASSYIMAGRGLEDSLSSASHGAGRVTPRGEAAHGFEDEFAAFMRDFRVVTPVDLRRPDIALRRDVVDKKLQAIREEAPYAFYVEIQFSDSALTNTGFSYTAIFMKAVFDFRSCLEACKSNEPSFVSKETKRLSDSRPARIFSCRFLVCLIFFVLCGAVWSQVGSGANDARSTLNQAHQSLDGIEGDSRYRFLVEIAPLQIQAGMKNDARETLAEALISLPELNALERPGAAAKLAVMHSDAGLPDVARLLIRKAAEYAEQTHEWSRCSARAEVIQTQLQLGMLDEAMATFKNVYPRIQYEDSKAELLLDIAEAQAQAGRNEEAAANLAAAKHIIEMFSPDATDAMKKKPDLLQRIANFPRKQSQSPGPMETANAPQRVEPNPEAFARAINDVEMKLANADGYEVFYSPLMARLCEIAQQQAEAGYSEDAESTFQKAIDIAKTKFDYDESGTNLDQAISNVAYIARQQAQSGLTETALSNFQMLTGWAETVQHVESITSSMARCGMFDLALETAGRIPDGNPSKPKTLIEIAKFQLAGERD